MSKGIFSRVAGAVRMGYYELVDPVSDEDIKRDEQDQEFFQEQYDELLRDYEWAQSELDAMRREARDYVDQIDKLEWERDEWKRRYDDLLANVLAPVQEGEPLLLPASKLKPGTVSVPSVWHDDAGTKVTSELTTSCLPIDEPIVLSGRPDVVNDLNEWLKQPAKKTPKKATKKATKKPAKKATKKPVGY